MFYLSQEDWSPRFGSDFFTVKLASRSTLTCSPPSNQNDSHQPKGNNGFPAIYFNVSVHCARKEYSISRRYSQFRELFNEIVANPPETTTKTTQHEIPFPPRTCLFQSIDEDFLDLRQEDLLSFMDNILKRPGYVDLPCVKAFLEMDQLT